MASVSKTISNVIADGLKKQQAIPASITLITKDVLTGAITEIFKDGLEFNDIQADVAIIIPLSAILAIILNPTSPS